VEREKSALMQVVEERERRGLFSRYKERANNHMRESEKQGREGQKKGWIERGNTD